MEADDTEIGWRLSVCLKRLLWSVAFTFCKSFLMASQKFDGEQSFSVWIIWMAGGEKKTKTKDENLLEMRTDFFFIDDWRTDSSVRYERFRSSTKPWSRKSSVGFCRQNCLLHFKMRQMWSERRRLWPSWPWLLLTVSSGATAEEAQPNLWRLIFQFLSR